MELRKSMFSVERNHRRFGFYEVFSVKPVPVEVNRKIVHESSHLLGPKNPFSRDNAEKIMKETMKELLEEERYEEKRMPSLAKIIANEIRDKLKVVYVRSRFKFVVTVIIAENKQQDLIVSRKQLHSIDTDASAEVTYRRPSFVAHAYTIAFYQE